MDRVKTELLAKATCPNCWTDFATENSKWVAADGQLTGDYRLGPDFAQRFLPTRFDVFGNALDVLGQRCQDLACPNCHIRIPRSVLVFPPLFVSIAGTPSCGKSFFLASMTWRLRQTLPRDFNIAIADSDGECNQILNDYENQLFFNTSKSKLVKLAKTQTEGDWYSQVRYDDHTVKYPKPFYFDLKPGEEHIEASNSRRISRLLCLYDNAGESFLPGADTVQDPVTRHLGLAEAWLFCFDVTQDPRVRAALKGKSDDVQITEGSVTHRQETVLNEMVNRIRRHSKLGLKEKSKKPLIVMCTKFDAWSSLLTKDKLPTPWKVDLSKGSTILNLSTIESISNRLEDLLARYCPEVIEATKALSRNVFFVPVSATGSSSIKDEESKQLMIDSTKIEPIWCEVPMLLVLAHRTPKLVMVGRSKNPLMPPDDSCNGLGK